MGSKQQQGANEEPQPELKRFDDIYDETIIDNTKLVNINDLMKKNNYNNTIKVDTSILDKTLD